MISKRAGSISPKPERERKFPDSIPNISAIYPKKHTPRRERGSKSITIQIRKGGYRSQREGFPLHFCYLEIHRGIQG